jgi:hypothetical protein
MRSIVTLCLILFATGTAAQEHFLDGNALYERLQKKDVSAMTYIFGVYDAVQIVQYHSTPAEQYFCAPAGLTGQQLADVVIKHLTTDEVVRDYPAGVLVLGALIANFPCGELKAGIAPAGPSRQSILR